MATIHQVINQLPTMSDLEAASALKECINELPEDPKVLAQAAFACNQLVYLLKGRGYIFNVAAHNISMKMYMLNPAYPYPEHFLS